MNDKHVIETHGFKPHLEQVQLLVGKNRHLELALEPPVEVGEQGNEGGGAQRAQHVQHLLRAGRRAGVGRAGSAVWEAGVVKPDCSSLAVW